MESIAYEQRKIFQINISAEKYQSQQTTFILSFQHCLVQHSLKEVSRCYIECNDSNTSEME